MSLNRFAIIILALANAGSVIGMTLITPSLTMIKSNFAASADKTQLILTSFIFFVAIGQLFFGTLSDKIGRRPIIIFGAFLYFIGGFLAMISPYIELLIVVRIIQGLGAAACLSMARVIVNDSFEKNEAAEKLSLITAVMVIFPNIALIMGGVIADTIGWQGSMATLSVFGLIILVGTYFYIPETKSFNSDTFDFSKILNSYYQVITNKVFFNFTSLGAIQTSIFFSCFSFMPYEFERMGVSSTEFSIWLAFTGIGYFSGNIINGKYASKIGISRMCFCGCLGSSFAFILMLFLYHLGVQHPLFISMPLFLFGLSNGVTVANSIIGGVSATGKLSGSATGIAGAIQMGGAAILGTFIIYIGGDESFTLSISVIILLSLIAIISAWKILKNY